MLAHPLFAETAALALILSIGRVREATAGVFRPGSVAAVGVSRNAETEANYSPRQMIGLVKYGLAKVV